ncbi:MAG TPA: FAD-dependent oxidoreductase [Acidobacteriaceae bacterium]|jgi:ferredoxin-NADP reductase|nr:FAD-dependent oxidoreductase [Acidobacteriaceae bacterium]
MQNEPHRETLTARLRSKKVLSESSQTWHLEFTADAPFSFIPGQFLSILAERRYPAGHARAGESRMDTRAYSLASAPAGTSFDLCLNRLDTAGGRGYFSNLLCDLVPGAAIQFHGPHGNFTLRESTGPVLLIAEETGIAPIRSMLQANQDLSATLIQTSTASSAPLYGEEFGGEESAATGPLHYLPVHDDATHAASLAAVKNTLAANSAVREAYIVGLSPFVNAHRAQLKELGWDRKQIIFERYD